MSWPKERIWRLRRFFSSATVQIVFVSVFGLLLYIVDVISDIRWTSILLSLPGYRANTTDQCRDKYCHEFYFQWKYIYSTLWPAMSLIVIGLPGIFMALYSLCEKKLDMYHHDQAWIKLTVKSSPLLIPYILFMPLWAVVVPIFRYADVLKHLWCEVKGRCRYSKSILQRAEKVRLFESQAEAGMQILLQSNILFNLIFVKNSHRIVGEEEIAFKKKYFPQLLAILSLSLISMIKVLTANLQNVIKKIGRINLVSVRHQALYSLWSLATFLARFATVGVVTHWYVFNAHYVGTDSYEGWLITTSIAISLLRLLASAVLSWACFGWSTDTIVWGILSIITPVEFIGANAEETKSYGIWMHLVDDVLVGSSFLLFGLSYLIHHYNFVNYMQFDFFFILTAPLPFLTLQKLFQKLYYQTQLLPLYSCKDLAYPTMSQESKRLDTFPPWWKNELSFAISKRNLSFNGHFYSDPRLLSPLTRCYACCYKIDWTKVPNGEVDAFHSSFCSLLEERNTNEPVIEVIRGEHEGTRSVWCQIFYNLTRLLCLIICIPINWFLILRINWTYREWREGRPGFLANNQFVPIWPGIITANICILVYWFVSLLHVEDPESPKPSHRNRVMYTLKRVFTSMAWSGLLGMDWQAPGWIVFLMDTMMQTLLLTSVYIVGHYCEDVDTKVAGMKCRKTPFLTGAIVGIGGALLLVQALSLCYIWKDKIRKGWSSATCQFCKTLFLGVILYLCDIGTDLRWACFLLSLPSSDNKWIQLRRVWPISTLIVMLLPGLLMAIKSICSRRLDLFHADTAWIKLTVVTCPLVIPYLLLMPVWATMVPLIRYFHVLTHLRNEIRGICQYDDKLVETAVGLRIFEGLAEAGPQLLVQSNVLATLVLLYNAHHIMDEAVETFFKKYLTKMLGLLAFSMISLTRVVHMKLQYTIRTIGNIQRVSAIHQLLFFLWALFLFVSRFFLCGLLSFWYLYNFDYVSQNTWPGCLVKLSMVLLGSLLPFNVFLHWKCFGWSDNTIPWGVVAAIMPVDFISDREESTRLYGLWLHVINDFCVGGSCLAFGVSYIIQYYADARYMKFESFFCYAGPLLVLALPKFFQKLYYNTALLPLYLCRHIGYPPLTKSSEREDTFLLDWNNELDEEFTTDYAVKNGHFYYDVRCTRPVTRCFACCEEVDWSTLRSQDSFSLHKDTCTFADPSLQTSSETQPMSSLPKKGFPEHVYRCARSFVVLLFCFVVNWYFILRIEWNYDNWFEGRPNEGPRPLKHNQHIPLWPGTIIASISITIYWYVTLMNLQKFTTIDITTSSQMAAVKNFLRLCLRALIGLLWNGVLDQEWMVPTWFVFLFDLGMQLSLLVSVGLMGSYCEGDRESKVPGLVCNPSPCPTWVIVAVAVGLIFWQAIFFVVSRCRRSRRQEYGENVGEGATELNEINV